MPIVERWNGRRWSAQRIVNDQSAGGRDLLLNGVSCPSKSNCTVVGSTLPDSDTETTLVEHWTGTTWSVQPTPPLPNAPTAEGINGPMLNAVACPTPRDCVAVGKNLGEPSEGSLTPIAELYS